MHSRGAAIEPTQTSQPWRVLLNGTSLAGCPMEVIDAVFRKWTDNGVYLNPRATQADLARLESALGTALPDDVRYYFSIADGMPDFEPADDSLTSFWSIGRMLADPWSPAGSDERGPFRDLAFADVMISSWFICFRVRPELGLSIHVEGALLELPSLEELFRQYLADPRVLCL